MKPIEPTDRDVTLTTMAVSCERSRIISGSTRFTRKQETAPLPSSPASGSLRLYRVQSKVDSPACDCQDHQARSCAYHFHQRIYLVHLGDQLPLFRCP